MALIRLTKQPAESRLFDFDFSGKMATGATISAVVSVVATPSGLTVGTTTFSGQIAQVRLSGGTDQTEYLITCKVTTSDGGDPLELDGLLWVENVPLVDALKQAALERLTDMTAPDTDPAIDLVADDILGKFQVATVWVAATAYSFGDVVIPATRNGKRYRCVIPGTGGATEPAWPRSREATVTDGEVTWEEAGVECSLWQLDAAASYCWSKKANLVAQRYDFSDQNKSLSRDQLYKHCIDRAEYYRPTVIA